MLYDHVPENFFVPLASPDKKEYWYALELIYELTDAHSFGVSREIIMDELKEYYDHQFSISLEMEEGSSSDKASNMIRKLIEYGWLYQETDRNYTLRMNFHDYAIVILRTLLTIDQQTRKEYAGHIYQIYALVKNIKENPTLAIMEIEKNTEELVSGLKNLNANIKKYIDELASLDNPKDVLHVLFDVYHQDVVDKAYHRLVTSDNIHRYRHEIIDQLTKVSTNQKLLDTAIQGTMEIKEIDEEEAREYLLDILYEVIQQFKGLDDIIDDISKKNRNYQKAAVDRATFQMLNVADVRGQLRDILIYLNQKIIEEDYDYKSYYEIEELDQLLKIFTISYIDQSSLYTVKKYKKEIKSTILEIPTLNQEEKAKRIKEMKEKLDAMLTPAKINQFVADLLEDKDEIEASSIVVDDESFIQVIYIRLYGQRRNMNYSIELLDEIHLNGYSFKNYKIIKKERA